MPQEIIPINMTMKLYHKKQSGDNGRMYITFIYSFYKASAYFELLYTKIISIKLESKGISTRGSLIFTAL